MQLRTAYENAHGSITLLLVLLLLLLLPDNIDNTDGSSVARTPPQVSPARTHTHTLGKTIKYLIIDLLAGYISAREAARDRERA